MKDFSNVICQTKRKNGAMRELPLCSAGPEESDEENKFLLLQVGCDGYAIMDDDDGELIES